MRLCQAAGFSNLVFCVDATPMYPGRQGGRDGRDGVPRFGADHHDRTMRMIDARTEQMPCLIRWMLVGDIPVVPTDERSSRTVDFPLRKW